MSWTDLKILFHLIRFSIWEKSEVARNYTKFKSYTCKNKKTNIIPFLWSLLITALDGWMCTDKLFICSQDPGASPDLSSYDQFTLLIITARTSPWTSTLLVLPITHPLPFPHTPYPSTSATTLKVMFSSYESSRLCPHPFSPTPTLRFPVYTSLLGSQSPALSHPP